MKNFCVDLEIAKELKENGFPQETGFYFFRQDEIKDDGDRVEWGLSFISYKNDKEWLLADFGHPDKWMGVQPEHFISSPISDEILKELPIEVNGFYFKIEQFDLDFSIGYFEDDEVRFGFSDKKLSNALAKLWLYLKKKGLIK